MTEGAPFLLELSEVYGAGVASAGRGGGGQHQGSDLSQVERVPSCPTLQFRHYLPEPGTLKVSTGLDWMRGSTTLGLGLAFWGVLGNRACPSNFKSGAFGGTARRSLGDRQGVGDRVWGQTWCSPDFYCWFTRGGE